MVSARDITVYDGQHGTGAFNSGATDLELRLSPPTPGTLAEVREDQETEPGTAPG